MSGKTSSAQAKDIPARSFYGESPPKRSRLYEDSSGNSSSTIRPAIKAHKDNLIKTASLNCKASSQSASINPELAELDRKPLQPLASPALPQPATLPASQAQHPQQSQSHLQPQCDTKLLQTIDPPDKSSNFSPVPLKNLGNTCYENSIIQCLFSLNMFMSNFEESMRKAKSYVKRQKTTSQPISPANRGTSVAPVTNDEQSGQVLGSAVTDSDVRFRIAEAFEKLYRSYIGAKNQTNNSSTAERANETESVTSVSPTQQQEQLTNDDRWILDTAEASVGNDWQAALSFCKSKVDAPKDSSQVLSRLDDIPKPENSDTSTSGESTKSQAMIPIALTASSATTATLPTTSRIEQSEIESKLEDLKSAVGERSAQFNSTHQQDASEFFYHVIDSIQEFYQGLSEITDDDNPVTRAFEIELDHLIRCPKCHHSHMLPSEKHRTLPLPLPHVNTENNREDCNEEARGAPTPPTSDLGLDSPESNTSEENKSTSDRDELAFLELDQTSNKNIMDSDSKVSNPISTSFDEPIEHQQVNQSLSSPPTTAATPPPQVQILSKQPQSANQNQQQPKQYTLTDALNNYFKDDLLDYPCSQPDCDSKQRTKRCLIRKLPQVLFISLARYSYTCKKSLEEIEAPFELTVPFRENRSPAHSPSTHRNQKEEEEDNKYQLVAIVCHLGSSLNAGHYTSYVYNQSNSSWYWCDDDSITKVQESEVAKDANKNGYCFFYIRKPSEQKPPQASIDHKLSEKTRLQRKHNGAIPDAGILDSSVVMTPESSPTSSPTPSVISLDLNDVDHKLCASNQGHDIDDWS